MEKSLMEKIKTPNTFSWTILGNGIMEKPLISIFAFILSNSKNDIEACVYLSVVTSVDRVREYLSSEEQLIALDFRWTGFIIQ